MSTDYESSGDGLPVMRRSLFSVHEPSAWRAALAEFFRDACGEDNPKAWSRCVERTGTFVACVRCPPFMLKANQVRTSGNLNVALHCCSDVHHLGNLRLAERVSLDLARVLCAFRPAPHAIKSWASRPLHTWALSAGRRHGARRRTRSQLGTRQVGARLCTCREP